MNLRFGVNDHTDFKIYEEAAQIAIGGAEDCDLIVDNGGFTVQHSGGEQLHLYSG
jgi:hypothetical protein